MTIMGKRPFQLALVILCIVPVLWAVAHYALSEKIPTAEKYYNSLDLELHSLQFSSDYSKKKSETDAFVALKQNDPEKALQAWQIYLIFDEKYSRQVISQSVAENKIRGDFLEMLPEMIKWKETVVKQ